LVQNTPINIQTTTLIPKVLLQNGSTLFEEASTSGQQVEPYQPIYPPSPTIQQPNVNVATLMNPTEEKSGMDLINLPTAAGGEVPSPAPEPTPEQPTSDQPTSTSNSTTNMDNNTIPQGDKAKTQVQDIVDSVNVEMEMPRDTINNLVTEYNKQTSSENDEDDDTIKDFFKEIPAKSSDKPDVEITETCNKPEEPIKLLNHGVQLCIFNYNVLPRIGGLYTINENYHLLPVKYTAGAIYHADDEGILHLIGLPVNK
jgi:hypothetical protein